MLSAYPLLTEWMAEPSQSSILTAPGFQLQGSYHKDTIAALNPLLLHKHYWHNEFVHCPSSAADSVGNVHAYGGA